MKNIIIAAAIMFLAICLAYSPNYSPNTELTAMALVEKIDNDFQYVLDQIGSIICTDCISQ